MLNPKWWFWSTVLQTALTTTKDYVCWLWLLLMFFAHRKQFFDTRLSEKSHRWDPGSSSIIFFKDNKMFNNNNNNSNNNNNHFIPGTLRFPCDLAFPPRGASTPLWGIQSCSLAATWHNPIPAIPPYVIKTPHMHGAPDYGGNQLGYSCNIEYWDAVDVDGIILGAPVYSLYV